MRGRYGYWIPQLGQTLILDLHEDQEFECDTCQAEQLLKLVVIATIDIRASYKVLISMYVATF